MVTNRFFARLASLAVLGLIACGGEAESDVAKNAVPDEPKRQDAGSSSKKMSEDDSTDQQDLSDGGVPSNSANADAGVGTGLPFAVPDIPASVDPPDPILPEVDQETPIAKLTEEQFDKVCDTYTDTVRDTAKTFSGLCGFTALSSALDEDPADTEGFRDLCDENRRTCELQTAAAQLLSGALSCEQSTECSATLAEVDACNAELANLNGLVLKPLGAVEIPPCSELTPQAAQTLQLQVFATLLLSASAGGGNPLEDGNACDTVSTKCEDFAIPGGGFAP